MYRILLIEEGRYVNCYGRNTFLEAETIEKLQALLDSYARYTLYTLKEKDGTFLDIKKHPELIEFVEVLDE